MNASVAGVIVALVAALAAIGLLGGGGEDTSKRRASPPQRASVESVARRVERIRELRFERLPRVRRVSRREARAAALAELDRQLPRAEQEAGERLLKLLRLLPERAGLRETLGQATASEVGGYYVPRTGTLALVRGAGLGGALGEVALAHELVHALEDQHFGLEGDALRWSDRGAAQSGLAEGSATLAMIDYLARKEGIGDQLSAVLRKRVLERIDELAIPASGGLPRYVRESLLFPYAAGAAFVNRLRTEGGWAAVDRAYGDRPLLSTEQLMHPGDYEAREAPVPVRLPGYRDLLPRGVDALTRGNFGEFDTEQLLRDGNGRARSRRAAAGWGGNAFELWGLPRGEALLVSVWAWDSRRDATEFERAARRQVDRLRRPGAVRRGGAELTALVVGGGGALAARVADRLARDSG